MFAYYISQFLKHGNKNLCVSLFPPSCKRALTRILTSPFCSISFAFSLDWLPQSLFPTGSLQKLKNNLEEGTLMLRTNAKGVQPFFSQGFLGHSVLVTTPAWWLMQTPESYSHSEQESKATPRLWRAGVYIFILFLKDTFYIYILGLTWITEFSIHNPISLLMFSLKCMIY